MQSNVWEVSRSCQREPRRQGRDSSKDSGYNYQAFQFRQAHPRVQGFPPGLHFHMQQWETGSKEPLSPVPHSSPTLCLRSHISLHICVKCYNVTNAQSIACFYAQLSTESILHLIAFTNTCTLEGSSLSLCYCCM